MAQQTIVMKLPETLKSKTASVSGTFSYFLKTAANFEVKRHIERHTHTKRMIRADKNVMILSALQQEAGTRCGRRENRQRKDGI